MELKWLEDFLALAKHNNFSRAAKERHLTQPAFSRRIRQLEAWLDIQLVNRSTTPIKLSASGVDFVNKAEKIINLIYQSRDEMRYLKQGKKTITIHTQHSLMVSHIPKLIEETQSLEDYYLRFTAENQQNAVQKFLESEHGLLLCFVALGMPKRLFGSHLDSICIGQDFLLPVTGTNEKGEPLHTIKKGSPLRMLSYPRGSFMYRIIEQHTLNQVSNYLPIQIVFENVLAASLKLMAVKGYGVTWLPESLIHQELENKKLVTIKDNYFSPIPLDINLYKNKSSDQTESFFWDYISKLLANQS